MPRLFALRDAAASISALYYFAWLYEIGNWISLSVAGAKTTLVLNGVIPVGVVGVASDGSGFPMAKLAQVVICSGATLSAGILARRKGLELTGMTLTILTGMNIASVYWEMLSLTSFLPMILHQAIFVVLSVMVIKGLFRAFPGLPVGGTSKTRIVEGSSARKPLAASGSTAYETFP